MNSLESALKIVSLLSQSRSVLRVGEVCRELGMPKSSVSRLLKALSDHDILERETDGAGYVVGRWALALSELYVARHNLLALADHALDRLIDEFQFACYAAVLHGPDIVIVRIKHGSYPLRLVREVGVPMPAFNTSVGRALLARKTDDEIVELIKQSAKPVDTRDILEKVAQVRQTGVARTESMIIPGIAAIGVAVRDAQKKEMLGFSISYPAFAADEAMDTRMFERIREHAQAIGERIGDAFWTDRGKQVEGMHQDVKRAGQQ